MGFHTFDPDRADRLEDAARRYRYLSREELLGRLALDPGAVVADVGSGTGFYTDDVAPFAGTVYAVDVQAAMHDHYRAKGVPENVDLVTAAAGDLPFDDGHLDAAFSTMTFHEFAGDGALDELARVLRPGGRFAVADWSAEGDGEAGPPTGERYAADAAVELLEAAGFVVEAVESRPETFLLAAER
ncbi:MAG: class I SAM-dependent methyltransferase [Halobacteriaceae archaeon]